MRHPARLAVGVIVVGSVLYVGYLAATGAGKSPPPPPLCPPGDVAAPCPANYVADPAYPGCCMLNTAACDQPCTVGADCSGSCSTCYKPIPADPTGFCVSAPPASGAMSSGWPWLS